MNPHFTLMVRHASLSLLSAIPIASSSLKCTIDRGRFRMTSRSSWHSQHTKKKRPFFQPAQTHTHKMLLFFDLAAQPHWNAGEASMKARMVVWGGGGGEKERPGGEKKRLRKRVFFFLRCSHILALSSYFSSSPSEFFFFVVVVESGTGCVDYPRRIGIACFTINSFFILYSLEEVFNSMERQHELSFGWLRKKML